MSFLTGAKSQAAQATAVSGIQLQTSAYGTAVTLLYGTTRIAPNLIWYGNFTATPQGSSAGSAGKGGAAGSGGKSGNTTASYTYTAAVAMGLCEGPIEGIGNVYVSKSLTTIAALGFTEFNGSYGQAPWGYLTTAFPAQAIGYSGIAYLATSSYALGTSAELPNNNFEVQGLYSTSLSSLGVPDADPSLVVADSRFLRARLNFDLTQGYIGQFQAVVSVKVLNGGSNYTAPTVSFSGTGTGLTFGTAVLSGGVIKSVPVTTQGIN